MDPGLLDVLHHPADHHLAGGVPHGVDVDLDRVLQEPVDQHRPVGGHPALRGPASRRPRTWPRPPRPGARRRRRSPWPVHPARRRGAPVPGTRSRPATATASAAVVAVPPGGWGMPEASAQVVPPLAVLGQVDRGRRRAEHQVLGDARGQLQRGLAPEADDHADQPSGAARGGLFGLDHVGQVLVGQWLEVEAVGGVVVGRDRLGIAVDHDGLEPGVAQRHRRVHAAVVELDALADPVGSRAEDDHPGPVRRADLVLVLVGRVVVGGVRLELGGAGVDRLEGDRRSGRQPGGPHVGRRSPRRRTGGRAARRRTRAASAAATPGGRGRRR